MSNEAVKAIAFYLPQYHPVPENSEWWGPGFTEWTNVAKARRNFKGHYQPHVPRDLGFYDLRNVDVMRAQAQMARDYGLHGFCFYYYRFNNRRILELPLNQYSASDIDFPFCYCWANENWTRTWDGKESSVLLKQEHSVEDDVAFIRELLPVFADRRYIRVGGKPMLLVYRPTLFPNSKRTTDTWRDEIRKAGLPGIHLCTVQFYGIDDPAILGFDAAVEFPPHKLIGLENRPNRMPKLLNNQFRGGIVDYGKAMCQAMNRPPADYTWYRGIVPSWDNTARRQHTGHIFWDSSPRLYRFWLQYLVDFTQRHNSSEDQFIFINAWNEWGEGAHLEPDLKYGHQYLEATLQALSNKKLNMSDFFLREDLLNYMLSHLNQRERDLVVRAFTFEHVAQSLGKCHGGAKSVPHDITAVNAGAKSRGWQRYKSSLRATSPKLYSIARRMYHFFG